VDDLPSAVLIRHPDTGELVPDYDKGIPVGFWDPEQKQVVIFNHLDIHVKTHRAQGSKDEFRIVGFEVYPKSVRKGSPLSRSTLDE